MVTAIKELRAKAELDMIYAKAKVDFADELLARYELTEPATTDTEAVDETECVNEITDTEFGNI